MHESDNGKASSNIRAFKSGRTLATAKLALLSPQRLVLTSRRGCCSRLQNRVGRHLKQGSARAFRADSGSYGHLKRQVSATASDKRKSRQLSLLTALPTGSSGQPSKPPSRPPYEPRPAPSGAGSFAYPVLLGVTHSRLRARGEGFPERRTLPDKDARAPPFRSLDMSTGPRHPPPGPPGRSRPPHSSYASREHRSRN